MKFIFLVLTITASAHAMQTTNTSAPKDQAPLLAQQLAAHAQQIESIRSSLWQIKGLLVSYQNNKAAVEKNINDLKAMNCHNDNIKDGYLQVIQECDDACKALSDYNLPLMVYHTQTAQRLFVQLNKEAIHFQNIVAKRYPRSNM